MSNSAKRLSIAALVVLFVTACGALSESDSAPQADRTSARCQTEKRIDFVVGKESEASAIGAYAETENASLQAEMVEQNLTEVKRELCSSFDKIYQIEPYVKLPAKLTGKTYFVATNVAADSHGPAIHLPLNLHMDPMPPVIGDTKATATETMTRMLTKKDAIDFRNKYYKQILTHEMGHIVLYTAFLPASLDSDSLPDNARERERAIITDIVYFKYHEFFADLFQVLMNSDNNNFSFYEAFRNGFFPGQILPCGRFSRQDCSAFRNFSSSNPSTDDTLNSTSSADHTFFAPLSAALGRRMEGKAYSLEEKGAVLNSLISVIREDYAFRVEHTRIGTSSTQGDYLEMGGMDGYTVADPKTFITSFSEKLYSKLPAFF